MEFGRKIVERSELRAWREQVRAAGLRLVVTNGCFDILHAGHVGYLTEARALGDRLLVGLNSDASVRQLKGPLRPVNPEQDRAIVIAALEVVSAVCIFEEAKATRFLEEAAPDVYVKGGDYSAESLDREEQAAISACGGKTVVLPLVPGRSTSRLIAKIESSRTAGESG